MRNMIIPIAIGLFISMPAPAANWSFLQDTAVSQFSEQDWELFSKAGHEALDEAPDGETRGWNNPESGAFGTIQPLSSYQYLGMECRSTEFFNSVRNASGTSRFDLCKQEDSWKLVSPRVPRSQKK